MASILLSGVGSAVGGMIGGPLGAKLGATLGMMAGNAVNNALVGGNNYQVTGARLSDLAVQTSSYGKSVPILFGQARFAGNVIWSLPIKEHESRTESSAGGKGGGGRRASVTSITYTYSVTLAIALCEGEIDEIVNIWADAKNITHELPNFRIYKGSEDQMPDPIIEAHEGVGKTPAYRGLSYIVIEDFPLFDYGNRIPNFTFEAKRKAKSNNNDNYMSVEDRVESICIVPGSGEFVYDTQVQYKSYGERIGDSHIQSGKSNAINMNNFYNKADSLVSLDQLQNTCKNIKWAAPVVGWFGTSLDIEKCSIRPGVEFKDNIYTTPDLWQVAGTLREAAHQITLRDGSPIYGGTVSDISIVRYIEELRRRGLKIMFYPMIFIDAHDKPWRGHMTGNPEDVDEFFTKEDGYNAFILHYAKLVAGKVDAFIIGSELKKITTIRDKSGKFVAVDHLIQLAKKVKAILGSETLVTYAADWSEYHHSEGGWRGLDDLWASEYIDFIGIDAYFPLTEKAGENICEEEVLDGWDSGECYDFYFQRERRSKIPISPEYALKNIRYWWENHHYNPDGSKTSWVPKSKKIWFTEFGFPSVDGATNQPNIFFDPEAFDGGIPAHSSGETDFHVQRAAINATLKRWEDCDMVENLFLWTWDARPYPHYPTLSKIWADGAKWEKGHWVNGKFGLSKLTDILAEICAMAGIEKDKVCFTKISDIVDGFVLDEVVRVKDVVSLLSRFYFFDVVEENGKIHFISSKHVNKERVDHLDLIYHSNKDLLNIIRKEEQRLPQRIELIYSDKTLNYHQNVARVENYYTASSNSSLVRGNIVLNPKAAKEKADIIMTNAWNARHMYQFVLPFKYSHLKPSDLVYLSFEGQEYSIKITSITLADNRRLEIQGYSEDLSVYSNRYNPGIVYESNKIDTSNAEYISYILDIPAKMDSVSDRCCVYIAVAAKSGKFSPVSLYGIEGSAYKHMSVVMQEATIGYAFDALPNSHSEIFDYNSKIKVSLISGELSSITDDEMLNGDNTAMIGDEIVQFKNAELIQENQYILSGFLRGRRATEKFVSSHKEGERFILLNEAINEVEIPHRYLGSTLQYKISADLENLDEININEFLFEGSSLKPISPVHVYHKQMSEEFTEIYWTRRSRIKGELRNYGDVPLCEEKELYEIEIYHGQTIILTSEVSICSFVCKTDVFEKASKVVVYQISSIVGRGEPAIYKIGE